MQSLRWTTLPLVVILATGLACGGGFKKRMYEGGGRDAWQQPERVVAELGLEAGQSVADLGSGSGYFTGRLARAVSPGGQVYAVDVDPQIHDVLRERLAEEGVENVEIVLGGFDDPGLPDGAIDLVFSSNTYHHIEDRVAYFRRLQADLRPGGRVALLDYDGSKGWFVKWVGHYTPREQMLEEMQEAGYRLVGEDDFLDRQTLAIFAVEP